MGDRSRLCGSHRVHGPPRRVTLLPSQRLADALRAVSATAPDQDRCPGGGRENLAGGPSAALPGVDGAGGDQVARPHGKRSWQEREGEQLPPSAPAGSVQMRPPKRQKQDRATAVDPELAALAAMLAGGTGGSTESGEAAARTLVDRLASATDPDLFMDSLIAAPGPGNSGGQGGGRPVGLPVDESSLIAVVHTVCAADLSLAAMIAVFGRVVEPFVRGLSEPSSRNLSGAIAKAVGAHPSAAVQAFLIPLLRDPWALQGHHYELVNRLVRGPVDAESVGQFLAGVVAAGGRSGSAAVDQAWPEDFAGLLRTCLGVVDLADDVGAALVDRLAAAASASGSLRQFGALVATLVRKHGTVAAAQKAALLQVVGSLSGLSAKSVRKKLEKL